LRQNPLLLGSPVVSDNLEYQDSGDSAEASVAPGKAPRLPASFFRTVIETANEGIWMIDCEGRTIFANNRMERMLAAAPGDLLGLHPAEFLVPEDLPSAAEVIRLTLSGEAQEFEPRFVRRDGTVLATLGGTAAIRDDNNDIIGAVATFSDVTAYKSAERALRASEREANETATLLHRLLESASDAIWMRSPDGVFRVANAAANAVMVGSGGGDVVGRSVFDIWGLKVGAHLATETEDILASGKPVTVEEEMFDTGKARMTTFLSNKVPVYTHEGEPLGILGISRDITERKRDEDELRSSRARLSQQLAEVTALYESAPIGLAFFDREYCYLRINEELAAINGVPAADHLGRTIREVLPENAPTVEPAIDRVFATGEAVRDLEVSGETPHRPGIIRHWLTGFYPVKGESGEVQAVGAWVVEISERKAAEQREVLLAREVDHRAKNLLAVVQSVVQLTRASEPEELKQGIVGRIQALARAHSLLAEARWDGAQLSDLVREELAPYLDNSVACISVEGPEMLLRPAAAQSLAIVLHELATNAVKYGGLSTDGGHLSVQWKRVDAMLELRWIEHGGPLVVAPRTSGFGSKIMRASIERQLHGSIHQQWLAEGLSCTIRIPAAEAQRDSLA
jgi:PAS domain S-box-containing protein